MGVFVIGGFFMLLGWVVSARMKSKFKKYSKTTLHRNLSGADIAKLMLADNNIHDVQVTCVKGKLTDHYNPASKIVNLSEAVYHGRNAAAVAVAAHECGHAVQHATAYSMLTFRSVLVPVQNISATVMNFIFMAMIFGGFFMQNALPWNTALLVIIGCYSVFALFSLITLPVEFDASRRALAWVQNRNMVTPDEYGMAKDALKWAAMTYVVATIGVITTLAYYIMMYLGGSRD